MKLITILAAVIAASTLCLRACDDDLVVKGAWIVAVPPNAKATAAFMTLVNKGDEKAEVVGGSCDIAELVEPMIGTHEDGMAGMKTVPGLAIPPGKELVLKPGGDHIMLMKLKRVPKAGETIKLTLKLACGCEITVEAPVALTDPVAK